MAMGLVAQEIFEAEIRRMERGRGPKKEVPMVIRKAIGETCAIEGRAAQIAKEAGLSKSSVDAYKHGATSTSSYNEPVPELKEHIDEAKQEIATLARQKVRAALQQITTEKLEHASLKIASGVARDMSVVVKNMDSGKDTGEKGPQFIFFSPAIRKETDFEIIDVPA